MLGKFAGWENLHVGKAGKARQRRAPASRLSKFNIKN